MVSNYTLPRWCQILFILFGLATSAIAQIPAPYGSQGEIALKDTSVAPGVFSRGDPIPSWVKPVAVPATSRHNPVVIRLADTQFRVGDTNITYVNRAIQVNENSALARIGQYQLGFVPQYQKIKLHKVIILRGNDAIDITDSVNVKFLQRESGLESGVYSGAVTVSLLLSDVRVGDTLTIKYSIEGENPVFGKVFREGASLDFGDPVEFRNVILSYPDSRRINWKVVGDYKSTKPSPEIQSSNGYRTLRWQEHSLDGIDLEPNMPESYFPFRYLQFTEYQNWNEVAKWANSLFPSVGALPSELRLLVDKLRQLPNEEDRVSGALQWVQNEIRYFSVSLGENSQRPHPPAEVIKQRFGDCKDKTYLLVSLLRELGFDAKPVLLSTQTPKGPAKLLPSPEMFDHVIVQVKVDGQYRYIDGTRLGQQGRLSRQGTLPNGIQGLVVSPDTVDLLVIETSDRVELNTAELVEQFTIPQFEGTSTLVSQSTWHGITAETLRVVFKQLTPDRLRKIALGNYERLYPGITLLGEPEIRDDSKENSITLAATYSLPKLVNEYDGNKYMRYFPQNYRGIVNIPQQLTRNFPLAGMRYPFAARYQLSVVWPDEVAMMTDPSDQRISDEFFDFNVVKSFRGNRFNQQVTFKTKTDQVEPKQLSKFVDEVKKFEQMLGPVGVNKGAIKDKGLFGIGRTTLQENIRKQIQNIIDRTSKTIADNRLAGEDLAAAYCDRSGAYADLGKFTEGDKDIAEAARLAPQLPRVWESRGYLDYLGGQFSKAAADYTKALSLGSDAHYSFLRRGQARFYQGKLAEAADDFAKAIDTTKDESEQLYASLWQAWTLQRLNKPFPPDLIARATKNPYGDWPRPALAMFTATLTPEQMLSELNKKQGDDQQLASAEAYFYLGQFHHNQGQMTKAAESFRMTRTFGVLMYSEHVAAGFELGAIGQKVPAPQ